MPAITDAGPLAETIEDFDLALAAAKKSAKTRATYTTAVAWLAAGTVNAHPEITGWEAVTKRYVRAHLAMLAGKYSPAYCSNQFRALQQFFKWLAAEENLPNPMTGMQPPAVPEKLVPVFAAGEIDRLLRACAGKRFTDYRDTALIRLFASSGARLGEIAALRLNDVNLGERFAFVVGKAGKPRLIAFDDVTALALRRYLRHRARHPHAAGTDALWVGDRGPLRSGNAIYLALKRRGQKAGVHVHPHRFRHDFSHRFLLNGGQVGDLMALNGWDSPAMANHYGKSAAAVRARASYDRVMGGRA